MKGIGLQIGQLKSIMAEGGRPKKEKTLQTNSILNGMRDAVIAGYAILADPGEGGTFDVSKFGGTCTIPSGTRYLPRISSPNGEYVVGIEVKLFSSDAESEVSIRNYDDSVVATLDEGQMAHCVSRADGKWVSKVFRLGDAYEIPEAGVTLSTNSAIQSAIDNDESNARDNVLAAADIPITTVIGIGPTIGGCELRGRGIAPAANSTQTGKVTNVYWAGSYPGTQALVRCSGAHRRFSDITFRGNSRPNVILDQDKYHSGLCVFVSDADDNDGHQTGRMVVNHCLFEHFLTAIQIGEAESEAQCAHNYFENVRIVGCDVGVKKVNTQGFCDKLIDMEFYNVGTGIEVEAGGKLYVENAFCGVTPGDFTLLYLNPSGAATIDHNNSQFSINGFVADNEANQVKCLTMEEGFTYNAEIFFDSVDIAETDALTSEQWRYKVCGNTSLTITRAKKEPADAVRWNCDVGEACRVSYQNCALYVTDGADMFNGAASVGTCHASVTGCWNQNTKAPILDYEDELTGSL